MTKYIIANLLLVLLLTVLLPLAVGAANGYERPVPGTYHPDPREFAFQIITKPVDLPCFPNLASHGIFRNGSIMPNTKSGQCITMCFSLKQDREAVLEWATSTLLQSGWTLMDSSRSATCLAATYKDSYRIHLLVNGPTTEKCKSDLIIKFVMAN